MQTDLIADMLTRIRNSQAVLKDLVLVPFSKINMSILQVLKHEGYISEFSKREEEKKQNIEVKLKYFRGSPVIGSIVRVSKPGLRIHKGKEDIPIINNGMGLAIISTSKGVMSDKEARYHGLGGEILCYVM